MTQLPLCGKPKMANSAPIPSAAHQGGRQPPRSGAIATAAPDPGDDPIICIGQLLNNCKQDGGSPNLLNKMMRALLRGDRQAAMCALDDDDEPGSSANADEMKAPAPPNGITASPFITEWEFA